MIAPAIAAIVSQSPPRLAARRQTRHGSPGATAADRKRGRNRLVRRDAGADERVDEIERLLVALAAHEIDGPSAPRADIGTGKIDSRARRRGGGLHRDLKASASVAPATPALTAAATAEAPAIAMVVLWVTWPALKHGLDKRLSGRGREGDPDRGHPHCGAVGGARAAGRSVRGALPRPAAAPAGRGTEQILRARPRSSAPPRPAAR